MIRCQFEKNSPANLRHVTVDSLVIQSGKILLVKRAASLSEGGKYALPGGFLERDETTLQGALRELKEETGYDGRHGQLFAICDQPNRPREDRQNVTFIYVFEVGDRTGQADAEITTVEWFDLNALPTDDQIAFDHARHIKLFLSYQQTPQSYQLPILINHD